MSAGSGSSSAATPVTHTTPLWCRFAARLWEMLGNTTEPRSLVFVYLDLTRLPSHAESDLGLRLGSDSEVRAQDSYCDGWYSQDRALARLSEGHELFVLRQGGEDVCYGWLEWTPAENRWVRLPFGLPSDVAYASGLYTTPAQRGRGLMLRLYSGMAHHAKRNGARALLAVIDSKNTSSRQLHQRMGFQEYQEMRYRRRFFANCYSVSAADGTGQRRWVTFSSGPADLWRVFWPAGEQRTTTP